MIEISKIIKNKEHQKIFEFAKEIGKKMNIPVYLVGGYIRDSFLQKDRIDIDMMVGNNVFEFSKALSKDLKVNTTVNFEKFQTSRIPYEGCEIEIANARKEIYDSNSRKPSKVEKSSIKTNLSSMSSGIKSFKIPLEKANKSLISFTF